MSDPFLGQIYLVGYNFAQRGFALAQGQLPAISQNQALFSLYGTNYGGDGRTTFGLPDLRGRCAVGMGNGPGLSPRLIGQKGGAETTTQTVANMPSHNHLIQGTNQIGNLTGPGTDYLAKTEGLDGQPRLYHDGPPNQQMGPDAITHAGGGQPMNNMQPFLVLNYEVALQGIYPSRN